ncbi:MAG: hypothetical protein IT371_04295 [Deltaproteobacteria bacterium]|nr:hypothetical protein [Deltaproteobacteria bacterium]
MNLNDCTSACVRELWERFAEGNPSGPANLEEEAHRLVAGLYERFAESLVLARGFLTVPYSHLPERRQRFAHGLAEGASVLPALVAETPVLTLLATAGAKPPWNDVRASQGHVAIPLVSREFVASIPMLAYLLRELGLPLSWAADAGSNYIREVLGSATGLAYVDDATQATDGEGRKIIAAQSFVTEEGVRSVFAVGGAYFGGAVLVLLFFCRERVRREAARRLMPLVNLFKGRTQPWFAPERVFRAEPA